MYRQRKQVMVDEFDGKDYIKKMIMGIAKQYKIYNKISMKVQQ